MNNRKQGWGTTCTNACVWACVLVLGATQAGYSQWRNDVPVRHGNDTLDLAWTGGLNTPQVSAARWNADALTDLLVHDRTDGVALALQARGGGRYQWLPSRLLPPYRPTRWMLLADANADGRPDLWCDTTSGVQLWLDRNGRWEKTYPQLMTRFNSGMGLMSTPLFVGPADLPGLRDVDGDGDMDLLAWNVVGGVLLNYHKNFAVEDLGRTDTLRFAQASECWGHFVERYDLAQQLYTIELDYRVCVPREFKRTHEGGTLLPLNLNADSLTDVLVADAGIPYIYALRNGGTRRFASMVSAEGFFPSIKPVNIAGGPALFAADATGDGVPDLLAAPNDPTLGPDQASLWRYPNTGTAEAPVYGFAEEDFLQREMIDVGTNAAPCFIDITGDGLRDLIIAAGSRWDGVRNAGGRLRLYRNVGSAAAPAFALESDDYLGLAAEGLRELSLCAADLDADGDADLLLGHFESMVPNGLRYYRNDASLGTPAQFVRVTDDYANAKNLGYLALAPSVSDLDADGDLDLVIGHALGQLVVLPNEGSPRNASFGSPIRDWGGIDVGNEGNSFIGFARPMIAEVTEDGRPDVLVGNADGTLALYPSATLRPTRPLTRAGNWLNADAGRRSAPAVAHLDGTDSLTVAVGNQRGGLMLLRARGRTADAPGPAADLVAYLAPNPSAGSTLLVGPAGAQVRIYDLVGRVVWTGTIASSDSQVLIDTRPWAAGLYSVVIAHTQSLVLKLVVAGERR